MKTAESWKTEINGPSESGALRVTASEVRAIQIDALEHALSFYLPDGNPTRFADKIKAEIQKLKEGK